MKPVKNLFVLLLALLLALSLCACGQEQAAPETAEEPAETVEEPTETVEEPVEAVEEPGIDLLEIAKTMEGKPVSELIAAIGEPLSTDYAPSCLGPGEDGELVYEGFTVYTYREGDTETVEEVYHAN